MMATAIPRLYAVTTHWSPDSPTWKSPWIEGRATFTINASRKIMKRPRPVAASVNRWIRVMDVKKSFSQAGGGRSGRRRGAGGADGADGGRRSAPASRRAAQRGEVEVERVERQTVGRGRDGLDPGVAQAGAQPAIAEEDLERRDLRVGLDDRLRRGGG